MTKSQERGRAFAAYLACLTFFPFADKAIAKTVTSPYLSTPVFEVIEHFRQQGYPFAYSTNLVPDDLLVMFEPVSTIPLDIVREILSSHSLVLKQSDGIYLVIREARGPPEAESGTGILIFAANLPGAVRVKALTASMNCSADMRRISGPLNTY